jgi:hypothetical protein
MGAEGTHLMSERFDHVVFVVYKRKGAHVMHKVEGFGRDHKVYRNEARCESILSGRIVKND